jgi:hypothetical protein
MLRTLDPFRFPLFSIAGWIESTAIADNRLRGRRIELAQEAQQPNRSGSPTRQPSSGSVCDEIKFSPLVFRNSRSVVFCQFRIQGLTFKVIFKWRYF